MCPNNRVTLFCARLLGRSSAPRYQYDDNDWPADETIKRLILSTSGSSALYEKLKCAGGPPCSYPSVVRLTDDIACDGLECAVETLRVVQVNDVFYEYVRRPCVDFAFLSNAKTVFTGTVQK